MIISPPVPASISFHSLLQDPTDSHTRNLADANSARAKVRTLLRQTTKDRLPDGRGADWNGVARAIADYLPYLYAILSSVEADNLLLSTDPIFVWKSSLSTSGIKKGRSKVALPSFHFELTATLLTYALCLSNVASTLVSSLGSYEISSSVSSSSITIHDETVNQAAETLARASGIFQHLAETVIPRWEASVGLEALKHARPIEFTRDAAMAFAKMCLADANLLAIRRLLSRSISVAHSTTTPGPPLPPSHPSPSLLAKLHLQVYAYYDESRSLLKPKQTTEISPLIRRYLSDGRQLSLSLSYKWLGVDAGERSSTGDAIGWLEASGKCLDEMKERDKGIKGLRLGKGKGAAKGRKGKVQEEVESVQAFMKAYKKVNDTVHFQAIPSIQTLQSQLPSGRAAVSLKPFSTPPLAFRSSTESIRDRGTHNSGGRQIPPPSTAGQLPEELFRTMSIGSTTTRGGRCADQSDDDEDSSDDEAVVGGDYFGAGQYF